MNIIKKMIMFIINFFFPLKYYKIDYTTNKITSNAIILLSPEQYGQIGSLYYDVFCYNVKERNICASNIAHFNIYGDAYICSRRYPQQQQQHDDNFHGSILDNRLILIK